jgi:serine/threonine protein kinase
MMSEEDEGGSEGGDEEEPEPATSGAFDPASLNEQTTIASDSVERERVLCGGRYRLINKLNAGGMGEVWSCHDNTAGIEVALKKVPAKYTANAALMRDIRANFQTIQNLHHPHIAAVKAIEQDEETREYFLIMEYIRGQDLSIMAAENGGTLSLEDVVRYTAQAAEALDYGHSQHIVHRDVKPANIMVVEATGVVKVLDYGIAAEFVANYETRTHLDTVPKVDDLQTARISGSPAYMSPEQWVPKPQDARTDQYSLAASAYHLLAGYPPYHGTGLTEGAMRNAVMNQAPPPIPGLDRKVWRVIEKALSKRRRDRYPNCTEFSRQLAVSAGLLPASAPAGKGTSSRQSRGRNLGLGVLLLAACILTFSYLVNRMPMPADEAAKKETPVPPSGDRLSIGATRATSRLTPGWTSTVVDNIGTILEMNSISHNRRGHPAISYHDDGNDDLRYAFHDGTDWSTETVDSEGVVGKESSLSFGPRGRPAIAYYDTSNKDLKFAVAGTNCVCTTVDSEGDVGDYASLSHGPGGHPAIAYYDRSNEDLKYAVHDGTNWVCTTVDSDGEVGGYASLGHGPDGHPAIAYYDRTNYDLKVALHDGTNWVIETVDRAGEVGNWSSLSHGPGGHPAIAYQDFTNKDLKYAVHDGTSWTTETVDNKGEVGGYASLGHGPDGHPAIAYYANSSGELKAAFHDETGWTIETVDAYAYGDTSLGHGLDGQVLIAYTGENVHNLKVAVKPAPRRAAAPGKSD